MDDILVTGSNEQEIGCLKSHLHNTFTIKDLGPLHYFLGIEVSHSPGHLNLNQHKYTKDLLKESGIEFFSKAITP